MNLVFSTICKQILTLEVFEVFTPAIIEGAHLDQCMKVRLSAVLLVSKPRTFDRGSKKKLYRRKINLVNS